MKHYITEIRGKAQPIYITPSAAVKPGSKAPALLRATTILQPLYPQLQQQNTSQKCAVSYTTKMTKGCKVQPVSIEG